MRGATGRVPLDELSSLVLDGSRLLTLTQRCKDPAGGHLVQKETWRFSMTEVPKSEEAKSEESKSNAAETKESNSQSWWLTVPGVLTGVAAVITAVTGLAVALHQISGPSGFEKAPPEKPDAAVTTRNDSKPSPASSGTPTSQTPSDGGAGQQSRALPAGMEVKLAGGEAVYKILSARLEPYNTEKRTLRFTVRFTNNAPYPANFWDSSFRLLVDDVPRAPISNLDELVEAQSAKEGDVVFEVPTAETNVVLQISAGDEKTEIPFDLTAARP